ncbi:MAG TPA: hypothetical protein VKQ09_04290 [Sphingomonas sp.]|nr:hypothetical protein [Sphingomonas sp.]
MIEGVAPVARTEAVALSVAASLASRQGTLRRQRRLRWLAALNGALGENAPLADETGAEDADEKLLAQTRDRIAAALSTIEQMQGLSGEAAASSPAGGSGHFITATELARWIGAAGEKSLRTQAHLGAAAVLGLVGYPSQSAMNRV